MRAAAIAGGPLLALALLPACPREDGTRCAPAGSLSTDTDSQSLPNRQRRLAFLARYLRAKSSIADAEYLIHYRDNSGGAVPGPSDWDIRAVLQVEGDPCPADAAPAWALPLLERRPEWRTRRARGRCYRDAHSAGATALIYEQDRLVIYWNRSQ